MESLSQLKEVVEGCIHKDRKSEKKLFDMYYDKMLRVGYQYAKDLDGAQDIVQNGFIKVFKNLHRFNFEGSLEGWVRKIIVNTALDQIRKNKRSPYFEEVDGQIKSTEEEIHIIRDEYEMDLKLRAKNAMIEIDKLTPMYRKVFNMYVIKGLEHKEISKLLGVSESTSKSNLSRAKRNLRKKLTENLG